jgi:hypothetical protein
MFNSSVGNLLALVALASSAWLPESPTRDGLRLLALGYLLVNVLHRARTGYLRRRPYWTPDSWRQFAIGCSIPAGAFVALVVMLTALALRLSIVGEPRSLARIVWAAATGVFIVIGGVSLSVALGWLTNGEATQQFVLPRWLRWRSPDRAP